MFDAPTPKKGRRTKWFCSQNKRREKANSGLSDRMLYACQNRYYKSRVIRQKLFTSRKNAIYLRGAIVIFHVTWKKHPALLHGDKQYECRYLTQSSAATTVHSYNNNNTYTRLGNNFPRNAFKRKQNNNNNNKSKTRMTRVLYERPVFPTVGILYKYLSLRRKPFV